MNSADRIPILLAPALAMDDSMSMDLYLRDLLGALSAYEDRFDFEVVTPSGAGGGRLGKQWKRYVEAPRLLEKRLREKPGAIVHVLDHSYGHLCRIGGPTVLTCHGLENFKLRLRLPWHQGLWIYRVRSMRFARRVVAISQDVAADVENFAGVPASKISLAYYGIDAEFDPQGPVALEAQRGSGDFLVLHVGMNIARKNIGVLLDGIAALRARGIPARLVKVGPDPSADGYAAQIDRLGLREHIDYLGWLKPAELAAVYRGCHALAFPSSHEGFGRPIVEAQACGLPVVVADTAAAREIGGAGIPTHPVADSDALAECLSEVSPGGARREPVIAAGFENTRRFSWAEHARVLVKIYEDVHRETSLPAP